LAIIEAASGHVFDDLDFTATATRYARAGRWLSNRTDDPTGVVMSMEGTGSYGAKL